jgi:hypothetical protein
MWDRDKNVAFVALIQTFFAGVVGGVIWTLVVWTTAR